MRRLFHTFSRLRLARFQPLRAFVPSATLLLLLAGSGVAAAQEPAPAPISPEQPSLMRDLSRDGKHNLDDERWNAYGQFTYIYGWKRGFAAPYTNADGSINSLLPSPEQSFTGSATLYLGARLWKNGEVYFVPEVIAERPLSQLRGIGGAIQDFELQKGGAETPTVYVSRIYVRQSIGLGGRSDVVESSPQQLGKREDSRRWVLAVGNFSILDFFDRNAFNIDPRQGLFNLAFLTYTAYDFASNARGYSWGGVSELYWDKWAVRYGRITPPKDPNQLPVDFRLLKFYGDQVEVEHHSEIAGRENTVRVLGFRNREKIGRFSDAVAAFRSNPFENATTCPGFNYGSHNAGAPDLCWVRKPNTKLGIGVFGEQYLVDDIGVFARAMYADGKTEVDAYTSTDRSLDLGTLAKGGRWSRPADVTGLAYHVGWISHPHAIYLGEGGIDGFVGDGHIATAPERAVDVFYSLNVLRSFWFSGDYQRLTNPAFNAARGPVNIISVRVHGEF